MVQASARTQCPRLWPQAPSPQLETASVAERTTPFSVLLRPHSLLDGIGSGLVGLAPALRESAGRIVASAACGRVRFTRLRPRLPRW